MLSDDIPLEHAISSEAAVRKQLQQLQRAVRQKRRDSVFAEREKEQRRQAAALRAELNQQDLHDALVGVDAADDDAARRFAELCNARLCEAFPPDKRSWIRLFRRVDTDGSGLISFEEFAGLVRDELGLSEGALEAPQLKRIWLALDADHSGRVTAGEFGRFMKRGEHVLAGADAAPHWRDRCAERASPTTSMN